MNNEINIIYITIPVANFDLNKLNIGPDLVENIDFKAVKEWTPIKNISKFRIEMISDKGKELIHG
jgi:hypothetical protein